MASISRIVIEQQFASVGIETTNARLHITSFQPQMHIENIPPQMQIDRENPTFEVNWQQVFGQSGRKSPQDLARATTEKAREAMLAGIAEAAREGDALARVEQPGLRGVQVARQTYNTPTQTEINLGLMPERSPTLAWNPGHVKVNWSRHQLIVEWDGEFMPEFQVDPPYSVEIFLRNQPYIKISIEEGMAPFEPGRVVDLNT